MQLLLDLAEAHGITVEHSNLHGRDGEYRHDLKRIRLRPGMTARHERSILAHELGHAAYGDEPSKFGPVHAKQERRADEWAAMLLINLDAYRTAERIHNGHVPSIANELGVITRLVEAFQAILFRTDAGTYINPRMGRRNYDHFETA